MKIIMSSKATLLILTPFLMLLTGCGRNLHITHNTFADTQNIPRGFPLNSSFYVSSSTEDKKLLTKEIVQKITWILEDKGYTVTDKETADYHLTFDTKMTQETGTRSVLTYIPGDVQTTTGCVLGQGAVTYQEQTETPGKFVYVPEKYTYFSRKLSIHVYDLGQENEEVWQGSAFSDGESGDLRDIIDYLLVSSFKYFGKNTQKKIHTSISTKNKEVKALRENLFYSWK